MEFAFSIRVSRMGAFFLCLSPALLTSRAPDRQVGGYISPPHIFVLNKKFPLAPDILQHCQVKIVKYF